MMHVSLFFVKFNVKGAQMFSINLDTFSLIILHSVANNLEGMPD